MLVIIFKEVFKFTCICHHHISSSTDLHLIYRVEFDAKKLLSAQKKETKNELKWASDEYAECSTSCERMQLSKRTMLYIICNLPRHY